MPEPVGGFQQGQVIKGPCTEDSSQQAGPILSIEPSASVDEENRFYVVGVNYAKVNGTQIVHSREVHIADADASLAEDIFIP